MNPWANRYWWIKLMGRLYKKNNLPMLNEGNSRGLKIYDFYVGNVAKMVLGTKKKNSILWAVHLVEWFVCTYLEDVIEKVMFAWNYDLIGAGGFLRFDFCSKRWYVEAWKVSLTFNVFWIWYVWYYVLDVGWRCRNYSESNWGDGLHRCWTSWRGYQYH